MIVKFPNQKTLYVACSKKVGSTSVTSILGFPRAQRHLARQMKHVLGKHDEWWKTLPRSPYSSLDELDYKYALVRDPVQRVVSCFKDRVMLKNRNNIKKEVNNWEDFINNLDYLREKYIDLKRHSLPQVVVLKKDPSFYDNIYLTQEIGTRFLDDVSKISECKIRPTQTKTTSQVNVLVNVTKEHVDIIKDYYSDDYTYWGDYFQ
jgi:hypothetical protein